MAQETDVLLRTTISAFLKEQSAELMACVFQEPAGCFSLLRWMRGVETVVLGSDHVGLQASPSVGSANCLEAVIL